MPIRLIQGAYLADTARVLGQVDLGKNANIWYGVAIRGDVARVIVGEGTNIQDNAVVHCDYKYPNIIGRHITVGHNAVLHGESIGDGSLIGIGAVLLGHTKIGKGCLVAAGAVVPPGMEVEDGMMVMGVPAKVLRPVNEQEKNTCSKSRRGTWNLPGCIASKWMIRGCGSGANSPRSWRTRRVRGRTPAFRGLKARLARQLNDQVGFILPKFSSSVISVCSVVHYSSFSLHRSDFFLQLILGSRSCHRNPFGRAA